MRETSDGLAFPSIEQVEITGDHDAIRRVSGPAGMTLRDYFAAKALSGLLANPMASREIARDGHDNEKTFAEEITMNAYDIADAMLEARK